MSEQYDEGYRRAHQDVGRGVDTDGPLFPKMAQSTADGYSIGLLVAVIRNAMGEGWADDSIEETARRVYKVWTEYSPIRQGAAPFEITKFNAPEGTQEMILVRDIEFASLCSHHLLPFQGVAHVAYIPSEHLIGLSKIPRLVDWYARMPRMQETLTSVITSAIDQALAPKGAACVMEAHHTCMSCRGVRKSGATMITASLKGLFLTNDRVRAEFYANLERGSKR